ncbi:MAG: hypothetical protein IPK26_20505 [Planctomycetes bacterium]|nr:hypothetical protein [Planctomycetota bacterium]
MQFRLLVGAGIGVSDCSELARDHIHTGSEFILMRRDRRRKFVRCLDDAEGASCTTRSPIQASAIDLRPDENLRGELGEVSLAWLLAGPALAKPIPPGLAAGDEGLTGR